MATELTQLAVGNFDITSPGRHPGVLLRDVTPPAITDAVRPQLALEPAQIQWMEDPRRALSVRRLRRAGRACGRRVLARDPDADAVPADLFDTDYWDPTMLHELAHEWFGDSVSPYEWSDLWLNEGHASWYEFLYAEQKGELVADTIDYPDEVGYATMDELMRATYAHGDQWRQDFGPVALPSSPDTMFSFQVYHGGALVLYALRQVVGDATFQRIERAWLDRYRDESASTADFIALASRVSHRDLGGFLRAWLYGTTTPPMPGHPDWTTDPVVEPAPTARTLAPAARLGRR
jgi:hypothetical protein